MAQHYYNKDFYRVITFGDNGGISLFRFPSMDDYKKLSYDDYVRLCELISGTFWMSKNVYKDLGTPINVTTYYLADFNFRIDIRSNIMYFYPYICTDCSEKLKITVKSDAIDKIKAKFFY